MLLVKPEPKLNKAITRPEFWQCIVGRCYLKGFDFSSEISFCKML